MQRTLQTTITGVIAVSLIFTAVPQQVFAQQNSSTYTIEEQIIYLLGMIAQLQLLLDMMEENGGEVISISGSGSQKSDVEVETLSARNIEEDEADIRGQLDLDGEDEALVWFQYGESRTDLDERTSKRRFTDSRSDVHTFVSNIDDLEEDEKYYFRAVAEDEDGNRVYGDIRSFITDEDSSSRSGSFELSVSDTGVEVGDEVDVEWEVPSYAEGSRNWIGLYETGASDRDYLDWTYIENDDGGEVSFEMDEEGEFEFRLFLDNSYDEEVTSREVTVE